MTAVLTRPVAFDVCGDLPTGTTVLEASAGTGKTFTIAALAARYVAEGHARLPELLLVTFGREATQELRERVRERLVSAERGLRDPVVARTSPDTVLALLAHGRSNGEIAKALFISTKTASVHVSNILRKLDVTNRVEAANLARRDDPCQVGIRSGNS